MTASWTVLLCGLGLVGGTALPQSMTRGEYLANSGKIVLDHRAARADCGTQTSPTNTMCRIDAANAANIASAKLNAAYKPGTNAQLNVERARIDATYTTARERCNALDVKPKLVCVQQAEANQAAAHAEVERLSAAPQSQR